MIILLVVIAVLLFAILCSIDREVDRLVGQVFAWVGAAVGLAIVAVFALFIPDAMRDAVASFVEDKTPELTTVLVLGILGFIALNVGGALLQGWLDTRRERREQHKREQLDHEEENEHQRLLFEARKEKHRQWRELLEVMEQKGATEEQIAEVTRRMDNDMRVALRPW
jgi:hypothetical protein